jgi:hypothetical protein
VSDEKAERRGEDGRSRESRESIEEFKRQRQPEQDSDQWLCALARLWAVIGSQCPL